MQPVLQATSPTDNQSCSQPVPWSYRQPVLQATSPTRNQSLLKLPWRSLEGSKVPGASLEIAPGSPWGSLRVHTRSLEGYPSGSLDGPCAPNIAMALARSTFSRDPDATLPRPTSNMQTLSVQFSSVHVPGLTCSEDSSGFLSGPGFPKNP